MESQKDSRRKYSTEEKAYMENLAKTGHPEMQVLAGGGGILAKTGQRVSLEEAALITTAAERPEAAAIAMSAPASAASAVADGCGTGHRHNHGGDAGALQRSHERV